MAEPTTIPTHVLIFPFPLQGHMNSMLKLSELLCLAGIHVTYLIIVQNHTRLLLNTNTVYWFAKYPGFRFQMLSVNVSHENAQPIELFLSLYESLKTGEPFLQDMLVGQDQTRPVTCLITDGLTKFTLKLRKRLVLLLSTFVLLAPLLFGLTFARTKWLKPVTVLLEVSNKPISTKYITTYTVDIWILDNLHISSFLKTVL